MNKNRIKKKFIENKIYFFTAVCSFILICIIYYLQKIIPLGENGLLDVDFFHQYGPFMYELHRRIKSFYMSPYSFTMGLGIPFHTNYLTYLASPINLIMIFFSKEKLLTSFSLIIALKVILAAITMVYYLCNKFKKKNYVFILLGLSYSLSGYFTAYYWNLMWFDGVYLLPLIAFGIEKVVDEGKWKLYTFSLSLCIFSNYFIGYMICVFSVIYFVIYLFMSKDNNKCKRIKTFIFASLTAGFILSFLLIPQYLDFNNTSASTDLMPNYVSYKFNVLELLQKHFMGAFSTSPIAISGNTNAPNIYVSVLVISLVLLFVFNHKIEKKIKLLYLFLLVLMTLPFFIPQLDFILHAFHIPNDLPYRYSFIYSFVLIIISSYSIEKLKDIKLRYVVGIFIILIGFLLYLKLNKDSVIISIKNLYANMIIITIYFICYLMFKYTKFRKTLFVLVLGVLSYELVNNVNSNWNIDQNVEEFNKYINEYTKKITTIKKNYKGQSFYRVASEDSMTYNDSSILGYYGFTSFSSMNNFSLAELQGKLGIKNNSINSYIYSTQTPIFDLMFNIKYTIDNRKNNLEDYTRISDDVYRFEYNNELAFAVPSHVLDWKCSSRDALKNQNDFFELSTGEAPLEKVLYYDKEIIDQDEHNTLVKYSLNTDANNLYAYIEGDDINYYIIDNILYYRREDYEEGVDTPINYIKLQSDMEYSIVEINNSSDIYINYYGTGEKEKLHIYSFKNDSFVKAYKKLEKNSLKTIDFKENKITGEITAQNYNILYTSIPYNQGWKVYVDGKQVKTYALANALLAADLPPGKHKVILKYSVYGMNFGLIITLITLYILLFYDKLKVIFLKILGDKYENRHNNSCKKRRKKHKTIIRRNKKQIKKN